MIQARLRSRSRLMDTAVCLSFFGGMGLAGCGGGGGAASVASPPQAAPKAEESSPTTIEEAEAQIARAKDDLATSAKKARDFDVTPPPPPAPPADEPRSPSSARSEPVHAPQCVSPCRALASMRRAVDALCRLAGDADARCTDARKTLQDSAARVATCRC